MAYQFNEYQLKWLEALESGQYPQGRGGLLIDEGYCCLGVGARVCGVGDNSLRGKGLLNGELEEVRDKLDLRDSDGDFAEGYEVPSDELDDPEELDDLILADCLVYLNDDLGWSFQRIAKFIRENPELVFRP